MRYVRYFVAPLLLSVATVVRAEVSDKVASPTYIWSAAIVVAVLAFLGCRHWPRASFVVVPLLAVVGWWLSQGDPDIMAAYCLEIGVSAFAFYMLHLLAAGVLMPAAALIGGITGWLKRRRHAT